MTVGYSSNALGGAGGPLAVLIIAIVAAELGKAVSKETRVDILVTPLVTIFAGVGLSMLIAAPIGAAASQVGTLIMWATEQAPRPDGPRRRRCRGGLLRPDDRLCRHEL